MLGVWLGVCSCALGARCSRGLVVAGRFWCSYAWVSLTQTAPARPRGCLRACVRVCVCVQACARLCRRVQACACVLCRRVQRCAAGAGGGVASCVGGVALGVVCCGCVCRLIPFFSLGGVVIPFFRFCVFL